MEKKMNNKGFSLVELIIVVAIMAVLIGVLAPTYLKYVESSKKTSDCSAIGSYLDACEVVAIDPNVTWGAGSGNAVTLTVSSASLSVTAGPSEAQAAIKEIVGNTATELQASWTDVDYTISVVKDTNGKVDFTVNNGNVSEIEAANKTLGQRLE